MSERWFLRPGRRSRARAAWSRSLAPALALGLALIVQPERELGAVSIFLLAVVVASVVGGSGRGSGARCSAFLPSTTSSPSRSTPSGSTTATTWSRSWSSSWSRCSWGGWSPARVAERDRATRREREARLLNLFTTKALSGEPLDRVLNDLAAALVDAAAPGELRDPCERGGSHVRGSADATGHGRWRDDRGADLERRGHVRDAARPRVRRREELVCRKTAGCSRPRASQIAVCLERARLDAEIADARLDAETKPAPGRAVLLGDARPADAARVDQGRGDQPARRSTAVQTTRSSGSSCRRSWRRPTGSTGWSATSWTSRRSARGRWSRRRSPPLWTSSSSPSCTACGPSSAACGSGRSSATLPDVPVDPVQIDQVLTNLLENAARLSPSGARSRSRPRRAARRGPGPGRGSGSGDRARGPRARVRGRSTARGERLPTRRRQRSRARDRARDRRRARRADLDRGSARRRDRGRVRAAGPGRGPVRRRRRRRSRVTSVLVVDDEPQIRRALRTSLEAHGYEVRDRRHRRGGGPRRGGDGARPRPARPRPPRHRRHRGDPPHPLVLRGADHRALGP